MDGFFAMGGKTRGRRPKRLISAEGPGKAQMAGRARSIRNGNRQLLERFARGAQRRDDAARHPDRSVLLAGCRRPGDGRQLHQYATARAMARHGRPRSARRVPLRYLVRGTSAAGSGIIATAPKTNPAHPGIVWDYVDREENRDWDLKDEPSARRVKEINGYDWASKTPLNSFTELKDDGTTACGAWIYTGIYVKGPDGREINKAAQHGTTMGLARLGLRLARESAAYVQPLLRRS